MYTCLHTHVNIAEHGAPLLLAEHMKGLDETSEEQVRRSISVLPYISTSLHVYTVCIDTHVYIAEHGAPLLLAEHMKGLDETSEEQVRNAQYI